MVTDAPSNKNLVFVTQRVTIILTRKVRCMVSDCFPLGNKRLIQIFDLKTAVCAFWLVKTKGFKSIGNNQGHLKSSILRFLAFLWTFYAFQILAEF